MTPVGFFRLSNRLLKAKDRSNLLVVKNALATFGWSFTVVSLLSGLLWLSLAHSLWAGRVRSAAWRLVLIAVPVAFITRSVVMPVIAEAKRSRAFMAEVKVKARAERAILHWWCSRERDLLPRRAINIKRAFPDKR